jgi:hypothetical protein
LWNRTTRWSWAGLFHVAFGLFALDLVFLLGFAMFDLFSRFIQGAGNNSLGANILLSLALLPFALLLLAASGVVTWTALGRRWVFVDGQRRTATVWWKLLVLVRRRVRSLGGFTAVTVKREVRSRAGIHYPVGLEGDGDSLTVASRLFDRHALARDLAEGIASATGLPVQDFVVEESIPRR